MCPTLSSDIGECGRLVLEVMFDGALCCISATTAALGVRLMSTPLPRLRVSPAADGTGEGASGMFSGEETSRDDDSLLAVVVIVDCLEDRGRSASRYSGRHSGLWRGVRRRRQGLDDVEKRLVGTYRHRLYHIDMMRQIGENSRDKARSERDHNFRCES